MAITHQYEVDINWKADRKGELSASQLNTTIEVATPPQFPKGMAGIWSPEHLLVAAVSSCLMTTFLAIAENSKLSYNHFSCRATGKLEMLDGKYLISEIILYPTVTILNEADVEKAEKVLQKSESACLISNSVKSTITMKPEIAIEVVA